MDRLLKVSENDKVLPGDAQNRVVVFKSCYPNSAFVGDGETPGDPRGPHLTVANARATMAALLPLMERRPDVLFVFVTTPPLAPVAPPERAWKWLAKAVLRKPHSAERLRAQGDRARRFNDWVVAADGWLQGYPGKNVVVFDYFDLLTGHGRSNLLAYPTEGGRDSHPAGPGNQEAAAAFVPLLNRAVRRAGLVE
jgi:transposase